MGGGVVRGRGWFINRERLLRELVRRKVREGREIVDVERG